MVWPGISECFGLKGVGPEGLRGEEWVRAHEDKWDSWTSENGLGFYDYCDVCIHFLFFREEVADEEVGS